MQHMTLKSGDPLVLTLAADARVSQTDYINDHIWELMIGGGEPSALSIDTTFGLRARSMRIFPVFEFNDRTLINPDDFTIDVKIVTNYPNYIVLTFSPIKDVDVQIEYWVPDSHQIAGRMKLISQSQELATTRIEWAALLTPSDNGERMTPFEFGAVTVLAGRTENLAPIFFMTGGPEGGSGPYPYLSKDLTLEPGSIHKITWVLATFHDHENSFEQARLTASKNWDANSTVLDMIHSSILEITTGEKDWDSTFQMAQKVAFGSIMHNTDNLPYPSYISARLPDQGYSKRGDGSDYDHLWNGQTPLETYFLLDYLLPSHADYARGLLNNFLDNQTQNGFIDWKPGLNGHRSQLLATPILACIALKLYRTNNDLAYLKSTFPKLLTFFLTWFDESHDRDQDQVPEWDHVLQTGFEDNLLFTYWNEWSYGISIAKIESPDLCAFLYRECKSLIEISKIIAVEESLEFLQATANRLKIAVNNTWNEDFNSYQYRDRDTHARTKKQFIGDRFGEGNIIVNGDFVDPLRLNVILHAKDDIPYDIQLFIHGSTQTGAHRIEKLSADRFQWHLRRGYTTSDRAYKSIDHINIQGISEEDFIEINSIDFEYQNQSTLLPLWAGIPSQKRAKSLIKKTLTDPNRYWQAYGIRASAYPPSTNEELNLCESINIIWNALIIEGLINYGYRSLAAELIQRNMKAIINSLKNDHAFRRLYLADSGDGIGEKNTISALAPLGMFMMTLGVQVISQKRTILNAFNPYPWSVSIKYRGLTIIRQKKNSMIIFPDGNSMTISNGKSQIITIE
jgi:hypothetical protein